MKTLKIKNLELGTGTPAICIPNTGKTKEEILALTRKFKTLPMDIMEWRADWFEDIEKIDKVKEVLSEIRIILADTPLLFTFRTPKEGGHFQIDTEYYAALNKAVASTNLVDLIDIEIFTGDTIVTDLIQNIHECGCKIIASSHDFEQTPDKHILLSTLCKMQEMKADILKIAVMPHSNKDVLTLLSATEEMIQKYAFCPLVAISMSDIGRITRIIGEFSGSCITFASGETSSAPGQIEASQLKQMLDCLHNSIIDNAN